MTQTLRILSPEEAKSRDPVQWTSMDCAAVGLHALSPSLFKMQFLTSLFLNKNNIATIPAGISQLVHLENLDLSHNKLRALPPELGQLTRLKELLLFHNQLQHLPFELGRLFLVHTLGLIGNPLTEPLYTYAQEGPESVLTYLLDNSPSMSHVTLMPGDRSHIIVPQPPPDRQWIRPHAQTSPAPRQNAGICLTCRRLCPCLCVNSSCMAFLWS